MPNVNRAIGVVGANGALNEYANNKKTGGGGPQAFVASVANGYKLYRILNNEFPNIREFYTKVDNWSVNGSDPNANISRYCKITASSVTFDYLPQSKIMGHYVADGLYIHSKRIGDVWVHDMVKTKTAAVDNQMVDSGRYGFCRLDFQTEHNAFPAVPYRLGEIGFRVDSVGTYAMPYFTLWLESILSDYNDFALIFSGIQGNIQTGVYRGYAPFKVVPTSNPQMLTNYDTYFATTEV